MTTTVMMMMLELFPSSPEPMEKLMVSPMASHRKEKRHEVKPSKAPVLLSTREALFAMSSPTTQRCPITPSPHQPPGHTSIPLRNPYLLSRPQSSNHTLSRRRRQVGQRQGAHRGSFETSPSHNQPTVLGSGCAFLPGKPPPLPGTECPTRLAVQTNATRKSLLGVNSQLRRQTAINIYDGKFHYLKIRL